MRTIQALLCALALAACDTPTVPERFLRDVYEFRLLTPSPKTLRWPLNSTVHVFVAPTTDATRTQWLKNGVDNAVDVWNDAVLYHEVKLVQVTKVEEADAVVQYSLANSPVILAGCLPSGPDAVTTFCLSATDPKRLRVFPLTNDEANSHVRFVVSVRESAATDEETTVRLVTHEMGHVLGIARHTEQPTDLMYRGVLTRKDLNARDRATLQVLYHSEADITP